MAQLLHRVAWTAIAKQGTTMTATPLLRDLTFRVMDSQRLVESTWAAFNAG